MSTEPPDWEWVRQLLAARTGERCEATGDRMRPGVVMEVHHRRARGMGGSDAPWLHDLGNLVLLTRAAHIAVHAHDAEARRCGLITPLNDVPWPYPVTLWGGRRVILDQHHPCYHTPTDPSWAEPFTAT